MKRIFVAVDISDEARRKVSAFIETLRNIFPRVRVSWEKTEKLHLTLKFLGETDEKQLEDLKTVVEDISKIISDFTLQISKTGVFPNSRNPRILWINVIDEQGSLAKINNLLESECEKIGFQRETRKFVPHLTIGRVREPNKARKLAKTELETAFEPVGIEVSEIVIYESILQPTGSNFQKVMSFKLN
jgi:RNA 2',3'-cyclic 3'-phosphodiesterase